MNPSSTAFRHPECMSECKTEHSYPPEVSAEASSSKVSLLLHTMRAHKFGSWASRA